MQPSFKDKPENPDISKVANWDLCKNESIAALDGDTKNTSELHTQVYIRTFTYASARMHALVNTYTHARTQTHMHTYSHTRTHTHTHARTHTFTHARTHTHTHTHTHTYTFTHTFTHTYTYTNTHVNNIHAYVDTIACTHLLIYMQMKLK